MGSLSHDTLLLAAHSQGEWRLAIPQAARIIGSGGTVAFPTETVYGLGADAGNEQAVLGIFEAKGRPTTNPLIVHVADEEQARAHAGFWNEWATVLARRFWPGPLTIVLPVGKGIAPAVLAGGITVGLRVPAHPVALELIRQSRRPIAAPSANRSTRLSPTSALVVERSLAGHINAILDGGSCPVGIESTVVDLTGDSPAILRPGMIDEVELSEALGREVRLHKGIGPESGPVKSPGQMRRHYSPSVPMRLVPPGAAAEEDEFRITLSDRLHQESRRLALPTEPTAYAEKLYWALHIAESSGSALITVELPPRGLRWEAIHDRLSRAAVIE